MKTKFIIGGRGTGKTTKLIREAVGSNWDSAVIVAANENRAFRIRDMLNEMYGDRNIVPVVTIRDIVARSREVDSRFTVSPKLYFDDLTACLSQFSFCDIAAAVIDTMEEIEAMNNYYINGVKANYKFWTDQSSTTPHIDHVIFNGPATIVFWKDGTKTVVKYDGKGRRDRKMAIMYAFMRKIYGEGRPYHDILNEIEEALK